LTDGWSAGASTRGTFPTNSQQTAVKPEITLSNGDVLSLNGTNVRVLVQAYGPNEVDWYDKEVELYHGTYRDSKTKKDEPTVLIRPITRPLPENEQTPLKPDEVYVRPIANGGGTDMDDELPEQYR
jgi:hypothetical protein